MPLRIVRAGGSAALWEACLESFLNSAGEHAGPTGHGSQLWVAHRAQRDRTLEAAAAAGIPGWLDPPIHFLSELRRLFRIRARPIGILTGRLLVARLAMEHGQMFALEGRGGESGPARSHMLDALFGELLAEGITPAGLEAALGRLEADDFARRRNDWVVKTYAALLDSLERRQLYDARQIHALVAARIERGGLVEALGGSRRLHVYGITSLRQRRRFMLALANQPQVDVAVYLLREPEVSEWEDLPVTVRDLDDNPPGEAAVQPAPDGVREAAYVARRIKQLVVEHGTEPRDVAVVARSGRQDTRRLFEALRDCGLPATARVRSKLSEVPALRALLELFRAQARGWDYRGVRSVLTSPYFGDPLDPAVLDFLASERRICGLDQWRGAAEAAPSTSPRSGWRWDSRLRDATRLRLTGLAEAAVPMDDPRSEGEWIDLTRTITAGSAFHYRRRLCRVVADRYDVVRLDQRAVTAVDSLLHEWKDLVIGDRPFPAAEWYDRLRRLLESNELALSTPLRDGVQILEAHEAALMPFRYLFLTHANDGEFPRSSSRGGILTDVERSLLREAGLPLEDRILSLRRERTMWRAVTAGPDTEITYRTATPGGLPLLPSLMVPVHDPSIALPATCVPSDRLEAISPADQRWRDVDAFVQSRRGGEPTAPPVVDVHSVRHAVVGAFAEELRVGNLDDVPDMETDLGLPAGPVLGRDRTVSERAHSYAGRLRDPVVLARLERMFGADHVWSAGQLQTYSIRPFDFLVTRVLRLWDIEEAEEETTPLAAGSIAHAVLEALYRRLLGVGDFGRQAAETQFDSVCSEVFADAERAAELWLGLPTIWSLKRKNLREAIREFVAWDVERLGRKRLRPLAVEHVFGMGDADPILLEGRDLSGRKAAILVAGRIDRVDIDESGWTRIVDYKLTNTPSRSGYGDGTVLQAALYMKAWERSGNPPPDHGVYLSIRKPGTGSRSGLAGSQVDRVLRFALSIPARVRAGLFEPVQAATARQVSEWQPGREVTRTDGFLASGNRFETDEVADG